MTELIYLNNQRMLECFAVIANIGSDDKGFYIILDKTIMYPQGGGQPADRGQIVIDDKIFVIKDVRYIDGKVKHYTNSNTENLSIGLKVKLVVDEDRRILNTKYHTAGHLISHIIENMHQNLKAVKGHQFPNEAYIEFMGTGIINIDEVNHQIRLSVDSGGFVETKELDVEKDHHLLVDFRYESPKNKKLRICKIINYPPVPCGGTHVDNLAMLGKVAVTKAKPKNGRVKVSYILLPLDYGDAAC